MHCDQLRALARRPQFDHPLLVPRPTRVTCTVGGYGFPHSGSTNSAGGSFRSCYSYSRRKDLAATAGYLMTH